MADLQRKWLFFVYVILNEIYALCLWAGEGSFFFFLNLTFIQLPFFPKLVYSGNKIYSEMSACVVIPEHTLLLWSTTEQVRIFQRGMRVIFYFGKPNQGNGETLN